MTPEEKYQKMWQEQSLENVREMVRLIAARAVTEEREACAVLAEGRLRDSRPNTSIEQTQGKMIATAIRARGKPS